MIERLLREGGIPPESDEQLDRLAARLGPPEKIAELSEEISQLRGQLEDCEDDY